VHALKSPIVLKKRPTDIGIPQGIASAFGDHAKSLKVSAIKDQLGNTLAAAGGLEAAVCAKMLRDGEE
jgi:hypothetical protein